MNVFSKLWCRIYQKTIYVCMAFMPWRVPETLEGKDSLLRVPSLLKSKGLQNALIVTDKAAVERGALDGLFKQCSSDGLHYALFDGVLPNPTIDQIESGLDVYRQSRCDCIIAFGGGSALDCAKIIGARVVRPKKSVGKMKGLLKIRKKLPLFVAVPTTAGTGSEVTVAAVISNAVTHEKYPINDFSLIPHYAVLDASLTMGLPPFLTATTGMDALTHAVEAYIGKSNTSSTKKQAVEAVKLIFANILRAYTDGSDAEARQNMQRAAFLAGRAFTRAYVGYVHSMAHALGGAYGIAHGLANSVLLPVVLTSYGKASYKKLACLAKAVGIEGGTDEQKAKAFIAEIEHLNSAMGIPQSFAEYGIKKEDVPNLAKRAAKEGNPLYPVPKLYTAKQLEILFYKVI
ncbi:MAG: iron-containing alcohol dehydrogenase [Corallococcus sp.]|nr:iron-containing alcohol dehydrogenase [Corallococcus sp.]